MIAHVRRAASALIIGVSLIALGVSGVHARPSDPMRDAGPRASDPVPFPGDPTGLSAPVPQPDRVDPASLYFPQVSCSPRALPGVDKLGALLIKTYGVGSIGAGRSCSTGTSEHKEGRALDWTVNVDNAAQRRAAGDFLGWLTANSGVKARRLGVMYVIYNSRIWSAYRLSEGWRSYTGYSAHTDHIHISLSWAGARGNTSFWTGKVGAVDYGRCSTFTGQPATLRRSPRPVPCAPTTAAVKRSSYATSYYGATGTAVERAQRRLEIGATGSFGGATWSAVKDYQKSHDLPRTGALDGPTWSSLVPSSLSYDAVEGFTARKAARYGFNHYADRVLTKHEAGKAVLVLQTALDAPRSKRSGYYGAATIAAVKRFRSDNALSPGGTTDRSVWKTLALP